MTAVAGKLAFGSDLLLIGLLLNPVDAAAYAVALSGFGFVQRLATSVLGAFGPSHAHYGAQGDLDRGFDLACTSLLLMLLLAVFGGAATGLCGSGILHIWLGHVPAHAAAVLAVFAAVVVLQCPGQAAGVWFVSTERAGEAMTLTLISSAINIVASVLFTIAFGVIGPALGSLMAAALFDSFY